MNAVIIFFVLLSLHVSEGESKGEILQDAEHQIFVKRSHGLIRDLVKLLVEEKEERKAIRLEMQTNRDLMTMMKKQLRGLKKTITDSITKSTNGINKEKKRLNIAEKRLHRLEQTTTNNYIVMGKQIQTMEYGTNRLAKNISNQLEDVRKQTNKLKKRLGKNFQIKSYRVGFTVRIGPDEDKKGYGDRIFLKDRVIIFRKVITNYGNLYNVQTGKFACKVPGLYIFHLHVVSSSQWAGVWIIKNGKHLARTGTVNFHMKKEKEVNKDAYENGNVSLVIKLKPGDKIWVEPPGDMEINHTTYFSGVLVSL